jgi:two-component system nitrogen regulation sensor histidine kinase NtrY
MNPGADGAGGERKPGAGAPRVRADRLILFSVGILAISFLVGYLLIRKATTFSWSYITNSLVLSVLFLTNAVLVLTLLTLLMRNLIKALVERRRGILGSRFRTKLVFSLLLLWLVPSAIIFWAAMQLIQRSIDRWFNEPMDRLTEASQQIVDTYYDEVRERAAAAALDVSKRLGEAGDAGAGSVALHERLGDLLREHHVDLIALTAGRRAPATVLDPRLPSVSALEDVPADLVDQAARGRPFIWLSDLRGGHLIRAGHVIEGRGPPGEVAIIGLYVPRDLARLAETVTRSNEDYRQIRTQKLLIKRVYILVFALITLVVLFSVTWIGLYLARRITEPVQALAVGTRAISMGNLDHRVEVQAGDELGILVDSFNAMTLELKTGKNLIEKSHRELQESNRLLAERRRYTETLLQNLGAGVISVDRERRITTINRAAARLLGLDEVVDPIGRRLDEALPTAAWSAIAPIAQEVLEGGRTDSAGETDLAAAGRTRTLALSATALRGEQGEVLGAIILLEDLTDLMRAQRIAAWREVARRLAHEIKNPLTPIQLSAERIRKKYLEGSEDLDAVVAEGTAAIVREVAALKGLVDEFARFARLPAPQRVPTDLREVIGSCLAFYRDRHPGIRIEARLSTDLPPALVDGEQIRRALVNLLDNAAEAIGEQGCVVIEAFPDPGAGAVRLEVADDGPGIPPEDLDRLFLPYFSTKKRGTGLGLAIVHRIVTDHAGRIRVTSNLPHGARFIIDLPVAS